MCYYIRIMKQVRTELPPTRFFGFKWKILFDLHYLIISILAREIIKGYP